MIIQFYSFIYTFDYLLFYLFICYSYRQSDPATQEGDLWGLAPEVKKKGADDIPLSNGQSLIGMKGIHVKVEDQKRRMTKNNEGNLESGSGSAQSGNTNNDKLKRLKSKVTDEMNAVEKKVEGELWWIFQVRTHLLKL